MSIPSTILRRKRKGKIFQTWKAPGGGGKGAPKKSVYDLLTSGLVRVNLLSTRTLIFIKEPISDNLVHFILCEPPPSLHPPSFPSKEPVSGAIFPPLQNRSPASFQNLCLLYHHILFSSFHRVITNCIPFCHLSSTRAQTIYVPFPPPLSLSLRISTRANNLCPIPIITNYIPSSHLSSTRATNLCPIPTPIPTR